MFKTIIIDIQHMGKPHRPMDRGAVFTHKRTVVGSYNVLDINTPLIEANFCLHYSTEVYKILTEKGYHVFMVTSGSYGERAAFANKIGADLYLACHLNSSEEPPDKNYTLVEVSEFAAPVTRRFATHIRNCFVERLPVQGGRVRRIIKGERGWSCISRVRAPALLLEPVFINHLDSYELLTKNIWEISKAIVSAIESFEG